VVSAERRKSLIVPREHGAWGILLVPLVTGAAVGLLKGPNGWRLIPLTICLLALFWLRTPVENRVGTIPTKARTLEERALARNACLVLAAVSIIALIWLFASGPDRCLFLLGGIAAVAFVGQALIRRSRALRTESQLVGSAGLTVGAPAAFYAVTGGFGPVAWSLWLLNFLFAANQIQFVQLRIRGAQMKDAGERRVLGRWFIAFQLATVVLLPAAGAGGLCSWLSAAAFLPVLYRGFAWFLSPFKPLVVHSLGKRELAHAIVFGVLLILAFALT
jgi:hypothetical protein